MMGSTAPNPQQIPSTLVDIASGYIKTQALYVATKLGIADHLSGGPQSSDALAQAVGVHPKALYRLLRALESLSLFREPEPGVFALTPLGEHLRKDAPSGFRTQILMTDEIFWRVWGDLAYTITTGQSAAQHVLGMTSFDYLQQHPEKAAAFNTAMTHRMSALASDVVAAYDFSPFQTITDIGGGHGTLLATILRAAPQAHGVVFDLPMTVEGARQYMVERGLGERCTCVGGDFFTEVPGGEALILSAVISDWDDEKSVHVLTNCRRAIAPGGRLLLVERRLVPEEPASPMAFLDLRMLVVGGGTGRSEAEYRRLLAEASFELIQVVSTKTEVSIFEARPV